MTTTNYRSGADVLDGWRDDVLSGKPPTYYPIGEEELSRLEIGPGLGKTNGRSGSTWPIEGRTTSS